MMSSDDREVLIPYSPSKREVFLTAEWRHLVMINYEIDPSLLLPSVPSGTEVDSWQGKTFISLVGFGFLSTKIGGLIPIPMHVNFEEVNLRFYVRREVGGELRRGVVFIREFVPRSIIAFVARRFYNENYTAVPMSQEVRTSNSGLHVLYSWRTNDRWSKLSVDSSGDPQVPPEGSIEQFITEHYWGYTAQPDGSCAEYRVIHPPWRVWQARTFRFEGNAEDSYAGTFTPALKGAPHSAFLAEGSTVSILRGQRI